MSILDFLLRRQPDPTREWPVVDEPLPLVRLAPFEFGTLKLGCRVESARFLGKPDVCHRGKLTGMFGLEYSRKGLRLQFEDGRLTEIVFRTGYDTFDAADDGSPTCEVRLEDGLRLNGESNLDDVRHYFGEPQKTESDEDETRLHYVNGTVCMDFEFNSAGTLGSWTVYSDE